MKRRLNLTSKMTLVFVSFAFLLLACVGLSAYHSGRAALLNAVTSDLLSAATEKEAALNAWIGDEVLDISTLAASPKIRDGVQTFLSARQDSAGGRKTHDNVVAELLPWTGLGHSFRTLFVIEAESGKIVAATDETDEGKFRETHPYYLNGLHGPYIQNPVYELSLQSPAIYISAPIRSAAGRVLGVLAGRLNLNEMNRIITRRTGIYRTDDAFLVNVSNLFVTQPRLAPDQAVLRLGIHTEAVTRCLAGNTGVMLANDYRGAPVVVAYRWLPERELGLIVKVDQVEAFAPSRAFGKTMMLLGGSALLFGLILSFVLARTITRPILALQHGVERFGKGDLNLRVPETSGDEIGLLAKEFNLMAANLAEKENKLQLYNVQLEQRVESRTAELHRSEERFRLAAESSTDLIYEWDMKEHINWFGKIDELLGYGSGEFPRTLEAWTNSVHPEDRDRVMAAVNNHLENNGPYDIEYRVRKEDDTYNYWWARGMAVRDEKGHPCRWIGAVTDITERKRAEEALRESERKFRDTVRYLDEGYYSCTMEGLLLEHNMSFNRMLGFDIAEDMKGSKLPDFWQNPDDRKEYLNELMTKGFIRNYLINAKTIGGGMIVVMANSHMVKDEKDRPVRIEGTFMDITDRKRAEDEIRRLNESLEQRVKERTAQLEAANKELEAFSYSVSHDLRAPLRAIDGFSRILLEDYISNLDEEGKRILNVIRNNTGKMGQLIDDLLLFSRLGRQELRASGINMGGLAKAVSEELKLAVPERKLAFTINTLIPAQGDQAMIRQVFFNLLSNSVKFTRPKEKAVIEVEGRSEGNENVYTVKDNGVGFDMQYVGKLFGVFQRLHSASEFEGTGVGLAIVQRIIQRHGGKVWAEGKVGEGASFYFTLPNRWKTIDEG